MTLTTTEELKHLASSDNTNELTRRLARECLANREEQPVQVTDGMALDFHHALTDGSIGSDELEEIKVGLRAALCNVTATPAPVPANAQPAGYFVRHRSTWNNPSTWSLWTECSADDYAEYCKRIATGKADAGRFYEARILYDAPPAPQSTSAADWGINMQTGTPILVYKNCSVIESEQAHYVLSLINSAATPAPAVPPEASPDDIPQEHNINTYSGITWAASWKACRAAMLAAALEGGDGA